MGAIQVQSPVYETSPVDCPDGSAQFFNAVLETQSSTSAHGILVVLLEIEAELGRLPSEHRPRHAARAIDLDLLYAGDESLDTRNLALPHPRMTQRRFVLEPLAAIRPELVLPGQSCDLRHLFEELQSAEPPLKLIATTW